MIITMRTITGIVVGIGLVLTSVSCTDPHGARRALLQAGYTHVVTGGYALWSCGEGDMFATTFTAVGPSGIAVSGAVCSGFLKGQTIRLD